MPDHGTSFRRAYQAVLDRTPPAPEWNQLEAPAAPPLRHRPRHRPLPRWLAAAAAAALLLGVLGGAALLGLDRGPATPATAPPATAPPASGAPPISGTPSPTVSGFEAVDPPTVRLDVRAVEASSELRQFEAKYLVDGTPRAWNDDSRRGVGAELTFTFPDPVDLDEIVIHHLADPERFARNFRVAGVAVTVDGALLFRADVPDEPGPHRFEVGRPASVVELRVESTHPAEAFDGAPPFEELAVAEVEFWGRPAG